MLGRSRTRPIVERFFTTSRVNFEFEILRRFHRNRHIVILLVSFTRFQGHCMGGHRPKPLVPTKLDANALRSHSRLRSTSRSAMPFIEVFEETRAADAYHAVSGTSCSGEQGRKLKEELVGPWAWTHVDRRDIGDAFWSFLWLVQYPPSLMQCIICGPPSSVRRTRWPPMNHLICLWKRSL